MLHLSVGLLKILLQGPNQLTVKGTLMPLGDLLEAGHESTGDHDGNLLFPFLCAHTGILPYKHQLVKPLFPCPEEGMRTSSPA
jgi:hypothetical protein